MNENKQLELIKERFRGNLQMVTAIAAVVGVVIGIITFFVNISVTPLEKRVLALEEVSSESKPLVDRFILLEERNAVMSNDVKEMKADIKDIRNALVGRGTISQSQPQTTPKPVAVNNTTNTTTNNTVNEPSKENEESLVGGIVGDILDKVGL
jgi:hypothetical protein